MVSQYSQGKIEKFEFYITGYDEDITRSLVTGSA